MTYIIAECGQNHNGSIDTALDLIELAAQKIEYQGRVLPGVDAVKFTKRELSEEMTEDAYNMPYTGTNSYGATYGKHREALELSYYDHALLYDYAKSYNLDFIETVCSIGALEGILRLFEPDSLKIASRDLTNIPLIEAVAKTGIPIIMSTGMSDYSEILEAYEAAARNTDKITILHCVSQYPAEYDNLNLACIPLMKRTFRYPACKIGYSDHTTGVLAPAMAVCYGAEVIEKHITLDHGAKGTDHAGSMDKEGLYRVVRDIRNAEIAKGEARIVNPAVTMQAADKLGRSICSREDIQKGDVITEDKLILLSPGNGIKWAKRGMVTGKRAKRFIPRHTMITRGMVE